MPPQEESPGAFDPEAIPNPLTTARHHPTGYAHSTAATDRCGCCRGGLVRSESVAAGVCLACRLTAEDLAVAR